MYNLIENAKVKTTLIKDTKNRPQAHILVNDTWEHTFPHSSRVSKHLELIPPQDLSDRLSGGKFFFVEGNLIDFRDGNYNGFVHDKQTIDSFMKIIGYIHRNELPNFNLNHLSRETEEDTRILLRKVWDSNTINVPGYQSGTDFNSILSFGWNPFMKSVESMFDLVRLICTNGAVGLTSFLNTKIPVVNRWTEHLDIATKQIQNKVNDIVIERVHSMIHERGSVGDCLLLEKHAIDRMHNAGEDEYDHLSRITNAVSPTVQLSHVYRDEVFSNKNLAQQLPAHLSNFDLYNIATELRSHTEQVKQSSNNALDRIANRLLFDQNNSPMTLSSTSSDPFSNPERAFFGTVH